MEKDEKNMMPENLPIEALLRSLLPRYVIEDMKDLAQFHNASLEEEVMRAILTYHAKNMADLMSGELK